MTGLRFDESDAEIDALRRKTGECPGSSNRRVSFRATLLSLLFLLPALPGRAQSADALIKEALAAYQSGQVDSAIDKLQQAHKAAPENPYARLYLGILLYQKDSSSLEAQNLMESVLDRFPANPDLLLRLMDSYLASRKSAEVASLLEQSRQARAGNHRLAFNIIYLLVQYAQLGQARRELDELSAAVQNPAAAEGPENRTALKKDGASEAGEASFIRGLIAATSGQKDEAMRQFHEADRSNFPPQDSPQMKMLADALFRLEEYALAAQAYQVYLSHYPEDNPARLQLAVALCSSSAFTRAQKQLEELYEKTPEMPQVNYYLGMVLLEARDHEEARHHFEAELKINPASYQSMAQLAYLEYTQGRNAGCLDWLGKAAALNPKWPETNYVYGLLYNRTGKYDLAVKSLESAVRENPKHIKAQFQLSIAYRRTGNLAKAKEHADIYSKLLEAFKARPGDDPRK